VASTVVLFATGVALLWLDKTEGTVVGLHKASFVVWLGAMSLHVLTRAAKLSSALRLRLPGLGLRVAVASASVVAGVGVAVLTLPAADRMQDDVSAFIGVDAR
jgi:hypothetical protein